MKGPVKNNYPVKGGLLDCDLAQQIAKTRRAE